MKPLIVIAVIGVALFYFVRKRQKAKADPTPPSGSGGREPSDTTK